MYWKALDQYTNSDLVLQDRSCACILMVSLVLFPFLLPASQQTWVCCYFQTISKYRHLQTKFVNWDMKFSDFLYYKLVTSITQRFMKSMHINRILQYSIYSYQGLGNELPPKDNLLLLELHVSGQKPGKLLAVHHPSWCRSLLKKNWMSVHFDQVPFYPKEKQKNLIQTKEKMGVQHTV